MRFRTVTGVAVLVVQALLAPSWSAEASAQTSPSSPLTGLLEAELGRFPGIAGLYVKHLTTGEEASVRGDERFESASTIKVAIMAHVYRMADAREIDLNERIELQRSDLVGGSGIFRYKGVGLNPNLRDLITEMIITSDNTATDMVLRRIGGVDPVNDFLRGQGLEALHMNHTVYSYFRGLYERMAPGLAALSREDVFALCCANTILGNVPSLAERRDSLNREIERSAAARGGAETEPETEQETTDLLHPEENWFGVATPREMGQLLERIQTCTIASEESCEEMRRILRNTQASGTPIAGALAIHLSVPVGHKTGGTTGVTNDVGIVYARSGPIVMAFYNKEIAGPTAVAEIRMGEVARMVVEYFDGPSG